MVSASKITGRSDLSCMSWAQGIMRTQGHGRTICRAREQERGEATPDDACPGSHKDLALALHQSALPAGSPHRVVLRSIKPEYSECVHCFRMNSSVSRVLSDLLDDLRIDMSSDTADCYVSHQTQGFRQQGW